jgi:hypothetical protein
MGKISDWLIDNTYECEVCNRAFAPRHIRLWHDAPDEGFICENCYTPGDDCAPAWDELSPLDMDGGIWDA